MKIELIEKRVVTLKGAEVSYYTNCDGMMISDSWARDKDEAKALYMLVVENGGALSRTTTLHETEVSDATD